MKLAKISGVLGTLVIVLCAVPVHSDIRSPTGRPLLDFYTLHGAIGAVRISKELCSVRYAHIQRQNEFAYEAWRTQYRDFLYRIEQHHHDLIKSMSKGDNRELSRLLQKDAIEEQERRNELDMMYRNMGEQAYLAACESFPRYLQSDLANFPVMYREHLQVFESWLRTRKR